MEYIRISCHFGTFACSAPRPFWTYGHGQNKVSYKKLLVKRKHSIGSKQGKQGTIGSKQGTQTKTINRKHGIGSKKGTPQNPIGKQGNMFSKKVSASGGVSFRAEALQDTLAVIHIAKTGGEAFSNWIHTNRRGRPVVGPDHYDFSCPGSEGFWKPRFCALLAACSASKAWANEFTPSRLFEMKPLKFFRWYFGCGHWVLQA